MACRAVRTPSIPLTIQHVTLPAMLVMFMFCGAFTRSAEAESLASILDHSGYSTADQQSIISAFHQSDAEGIPRVVLLPRLQQGIERGADAQAVIVVLERNVRLLVRARRVLDTVADGKRYVADRSAWSLTAASLGSGADESLVRSLAEASQGSTLKYRYALLLYGSLANWGLEASDIRRVTVAAIQSPLSATQYSAISDIFLRARALQIPPQRLVQRLLEALPHSTSYEDLENRVLY